MPREPTLALSPSGASAMIAASKPSPAMTRKMCCRGPLVLAGLVSDGEPADVDPLVLAGQRDPQRVAEVVDGQVEVAGQQVAGAAGQQPHRRLAADHRLGHRADGAVTAEGADQVDALARGPAGPARCRGPRSVVEDEQRLGPAVVDATAR